MDIFSLGDINILINYPRLNEFCSYNVNFIFHYQIGCVISDLYFEGD